ncbi:uncharacterized protein [Penaeus vannamei]|uniref:uncharacterized protein n=1 Tax=Penaeus vannamei TaxID=6689 RepID=UPI00387F5833
MQLITPFQRRNRRDREKCNEAKEIWLNGECEEMEASMSRNSNELYDKVKKLSGKKGNSRSGCIRSEDGVMLTESQDICNRWVRYIKELFDDTRNDPPTIEAEIEAPEISRDEIRSGMKKMRKGKVVGPDEVSVEMLEALDEEGIDLLYRIFNDIYDTGEFPDDFLLNHYSSACRRSPGRQSAKTTVPSA